MISVSIPDIVCFGKCPFDAIWAEEEHVDLNCELMHVLRGKVEVITHDYAITGREGDTIYTPAGTPHRDVFSVDEPFEVYLVQFKWPTETEMIASFSPVQLSQIPGSGKKRISAEFRRLYQDFASDLPYSREVASLRLLQIIYMLRQHAALSQTGTSRGCDDTSIRRTQIMSLAKRVIEKRFHTPLALEDISSELNISPYYLSHVFSRESGFTLCQYLRDVRMENAERLLLSNHRLNISEVALAVGYTDPIYFSKVFKTHFGKPPKTYRESNLRNE